MSIGASAIPGSKLVRLVKQSAGNEVAIIGNLLQLLVVKFRI